jgi:polyhydroxyalkanoate synthesis regulator protein
MQGMMGSYLEKNIQVFIDIQNKMSENSRGVIDEKSFSPEMWTQFMSVQAPMMQGMMSNYIEQSKSLFMQMQDQMQSQAKNVFGVFPFPGVPTAGGTDTK